MFKPCRSGKMSPEGCYVWFREDCEESGAGSVEEKIQHMDEYIYRKSFHPGTKRSKMATKPKHKAAITEIKPVLY